MRRIICYVHEGGIHELDIVYEGGNVIPTDRELAAYSGAKALHGQPETDSLLLTGGLVRDADLGLGRSDK